MNFKPTIIINTSRKMVESRDDYELTRSHNLAVSLAVPDASEMIKKSFAPDRYKRHRAKALKQKNKRLR